MLPREGMLGLRHSVGEESSMKIAIAVAFLLILASLGSALVYLMRDKGQSNRTVTALAIRVGLSILLFLSLLLAHRLGLIESTGIRI